MQSQGVKEWPTADHRGEAAPGSPHVARSRRHANSGPFLMPFKMGEAAARGNVGRALRNGCMVQTGQTHLAVKAVY